MASKFWLNGPTVFHDGCLGEPEHSFEGTIKMGCDDLNQFVMNPLGEVIGTTDIYLVDQIMKGRYKENEVVLDAGCGYGRNVHWFMRTEMMIYGVDRDGDAIAELKHRYRVRGGRFLVSEVEKMPFEGEQFDHIISSAVLHFARDTAHFRCMMAEMVRVL